MTRDSTRRIVTGVIGLDVVLTLALMGTSGVRAGGDTFAVAIREFTRNGEYGARFIVVVAPGEQPLPGGCRELHVRARYAWWKWWWDDVAGRVNHRSQIAALTLLEDAAARGDLLGFGYVGTGWEAPDVSQPCLVTSNALVEWREAPPSGAKTSVISFFTAP
jgi:hypothetical protein